VALGLFLLCRMAKVLLAPPRASEAGLAPLPSFAHSAHREASTGRKRADKEGWGEREPGTSSGTR
jgi:hypothetical protein